MPTSRASTSAARNARKRGKLRGIGLSNTIERAAAPGTEGAEVRFDKSGSVTLFAGSNSQGQGHETVFKQIVADRLGIHPDDIRYVQGDTDQVFYGEGTGGSRSATMGGSAFCEATDKVIEKATAIAAHALKVDAADVKFADGVFSSAENQPHHDDQGSRRPTRSCRQRFRPTWSRALPPPPCTKRRSTIIRMAATSANSKSTWKPA